MLKKALILALLATTASGCMIRPQPLDPQFVSSLASRNLEEITAGQEPVNGAISLHEAMARALKYNLEFKVELMQKALRIRQLNLAHYSLLPKIVANSGYTWRNNYSGGSSREIISPKELGAQSLQSSTSQNRSLLTADLSFSWSILDFGLSYIRAKQAADEVLIANELKRKVVNKVIEDVRTAYWQALSAQKLVTRLQQLEARVRRALASSRAISAGNQVSPVEALKYERELVSVKREIQRLLRTLMAAKSELASLMNLRPGTRYRLAEPAGERSSPHLDMDLHAMLKHAAARRPEIREVLYKARINSNEVDAALLEMLPGIQMFANANVDSNTLLFNNHWVGWGAKASWNLLKVFSYPARRGTIKARSQLLKQRALALTMAVVTQVHVARARHRHYQLELTTAREYLNVQRRLLRQLQVGAVAGSVTEQALIREELNTLVAEAKVDLAHARFRNGTAGVLAAIGADPYSGPAVDTLSVAELTQTLRTNWFERQ